MSDCGCNYISSNTGRVIHSAKCTSGEIFKALARVGYANDNIFNAQYHAVQWQEEVMALKLELERVKKIAHEVCEFYSDVSNWGDAYNGFIADVDLDGNNGWKGGKLARAKKKELEELG